jgi:hypothetical protein
MMEKIRPQMHKKIGSRRLHSKAEAILADASCKDIVDSSI